MARVGGRKPEYLALRERKYYAKAGKLRGPKRVQRNKGRVPPPDLDDLEAIELLNLKIR